MLKNKAFVGFDCHKETHHCVVIDLEAKKIKSFQLNNSQLGIKKCIKQLLKLKDRHEMFIGVEGSKNYGKHLAKALVKDGFKTHEVCSSLTKSRRGKVSGLGKSDEQDADIVARIVRDEKDKLPIVSFNPEIEILKKLTTRRNDLVKMRTQELNRLHSSLLELDPTYRNKGSITTSLKTRDYWMNYCRQWLKKENTSPLERVTLLNIKSILEMIEGLSESIREIEKEIIANETSGTKLLRSVKGISYILAAEIMANIDSIKRFENAGKLASYCGLAPITFSSGKGSKTRVNLKGNRRLNTLLDRVALSAVRYDQLSAMYYEKKISEGKSKKQARRYFARRLVKILFAILSSGKPYNPNHVPLKTKIVQLQRIWGTVSEAGNNNIKVA